MKSFERVGKEKIISMMALTSRRSSLYELGHPGIRRTTGISTKLSTEFGTDSRVPIQNGGTCGSSSSNINLRVKPEVHRELVLLIFMTMLEFCFWTHMSDISKRILRRLDLSDRPPCPICLSLP